MTYAKGGTITIQTEMVRDAIESHDTALRRRTDEWLIKTRLAEI